MADQTATYIDAKGEKKTGSVSPTSSGYWKDTAERYKAQLDAQNKANAEASALQKQLREQSAEQEIAALGEEYGRTNKQLYLDAVRAQNRLPQQLEAMGITGGAAESSLIKLQNAYGENLANNERSRLASVAQIRNALAQQNTSADLEQLQLNAQLQNQYDANLMALESQKYQQQVSLAQSAMEYGDYDQAVALGLLSPSQAVRLRKIWEYENPQLVKALNGDKGRGALPQEEKSDYQKLYEEAVKVYFGSGESGGAVDDFLGQNTGALSASEMSRLWRQLGEEGFSSSRKREQKSSQKSKVKSRRTGAQE